MTFNVFMTVDRLCGLLMSHYLKSGGGESIGDEDFGVDVKATENVKIRWLLVLC